MYNGKYGDARNLSKWRDSKTTLPTPCSKETCQFVKGYMNYTYSPDYGFDQYKYCLFHLPYDLYNEKYENQGKYPWVAASNRRDDLLSRFNNGITNIAQNFNTSREECLNLEGAVFAQPFRPPNLANGRAISFKKCKFHGSFDMSDYELKGDIFFNHSEFIREANFHNTHFPGKSTFLNAIFHGPANFSVSHNHAHALTINDILFSNAKFYERINFRNRAFKGEASFVGAVFKKAPIFFETKFNESVNFDEAEFISTQYEDNGKYRNLEKKMDEAGTIKYKAKFFALEQKCLLKGKETTLSHKLGIYAYWGFSNFGQSYTYPFIWLIIIQFVFFWIFRYSWSDEALQILFLNAFRPLSFVKACDITNMNLLEYILAIIHTLLTYTSSALFILAVRRKFRLQ